MVDALHLLKSNVWIPPNRSFTKSGAYQSICPPLFVLPVPVQLVKPHTDGNADYHRWLNVVTLVLPWHGLVEFPLKVNLS